MLLGNPNGHGSRAFNLNGCLYAAVCECGAVLPITDPLSSLSTLSYLATVFCGSELPPLLSKSCPAA